MDPHDFKKIMNDFVMRSTAYEGQRLRYCGPNHFQESSFSGAHQNTQVDGFMN